MGCDIHIFLERYIDGEWECVDTFPTVVVDRYLRSSTVRTSSLPDYLHHNITDRDYKLFSAIAGVRIQASTEQSRMPRGFPQDASKPVKRIFNEWGNDAHSASWLFADEFCEAYLTHKISPEEVSKLIAYRMEHSEDSLWEVVMNMHIHDVHPEHADPQNYRFVFFFDN